VELDKLSRRVRKVADVVERRLRAARLAHPRPGEREPLYTARCISPLIAEAVTGIGLPDLVCTGDGLGPVPKVYFLGVDQRPDIAISSYSNRLIAIEVKFLTGNKLSSQASLAVGQAALYQLAGFHTTMIVLIDTALRLQQGDISKAFRLFANQKDFRLLFFQRWKDQLRPLIAEAV
jgi:hypothetical protein